MPGLLYHLTFAKEIYRQLCNEFALNELDFLSGNLIPDLSSEKSIAHYSIKASLQGFWVPNLIIAKKDLFIPNNSIKLGIYTHLYLDYHFVENFLIPEFIWDTKNKKIINPRNNKEWNEYSFFSKDGIYSSYTQMNHLLLSDGYVSLDEIKKIPIELPKTGIKVFDKRRKKTWLTELEEYLENPKIYTSNLLDYNHLCNFIKKTAKQFIKESIS